MENAQIKQRVLNFISVYRKYYNLPEVLAIFENTPEIEKHSRKISEILGGEYNPDDHPNIYLVHKEDEEVKLVKTSRIKKTLFRRSRLDRDTQEDLPDEEWDLRCNEIIKALVKRIPGLKDDINKLELEEGERQLKAR